MRVLHLVHQYPPHSVGGTELYTRSLAEALTARGHQITVCYRASAEGAGFQCRTEAGVRVVEMCAGRLTPVRRFLAGFGDGATRRAFAQLLDEVRPELVHIQHLMGLPLSLVGCVQERGISFLITLHDYWWVCANAQLITNYSGEPCEGPRAFLNCARCALARANQSAAALLPLGHLWPAVPVMALLMAWRGRRLHSVLHEAQCLIAPSQFVRDWYASHGVPADRLHLLPHGLAWPLNLMRKREPATALRLAYIGGLSWQKGVHVLLDALDGVRGQVELSIAGDESFDPGYVAQLKSKARLNVRFFGLLSHQCVWEVLSQTDVVVIPSLWNETFSLIAHEAFAAGVPVAASRAGALSDTVHDGQDGLLVSPGDVTAWREALQRLINQPDLVAKLRANVKPPLTMAEHAECIERLYIKCCQV